MGSSGGKNRFSYSLGLMKSIVSMYQYRATKSPENLFWQDFSENLALKFPTRKSEISLFHNVRKHSIIKLFNFLLIPSIIMGKKTTHFLTPEISPSIGKTGIKYIQTNGNIAELITRLGARYQETAYRYQQLDKRYRESMIILNRKGNKTIMTNSQSPKSK